VLIRFHKRRLTCPAIRPIYTIGHLEKRPFSIASHTPHKKPCPLGAAEAPGYHYTEIFPRLYTIVAQPIPITIPINNILPASQHQTRLSSGANSLIHKHDITHFFALHIPFHIKWATDHSPAPQQTRKKRRKPPPPFTVSVLLKHSDRLCSGSVDHRPITVTNPGSCILELPYHPHQDD